MQLSHGLVGGEKDKFYEDLEVRGLSSATESECWGARHKSSVTPMSAFPLRFSVPRLPLGISQKTSYAVFIF